MKRPYLITIAAVAAIAQTRVHARVDVAEALFRAGLFLLTHDAIWAVIDTVKRRQLVARALDTRAGYAAAMWWLRRRTWKPRVPPAHRGHGQTTPTGAP